MAIKDNTNGVLSEMDKLIADKLETAALMVESSAKDEFVPVKTGTLKRSITHKVEKRTAVIGSNVEYASHVEMGTTKMTARPYLRPSLEKNWPAIKKLFGAK